MADISPWKDNDDRQTFVNFRNSINQIDKKNKLVDKSFKQLDVQKLQVEAKNKADFINQEQLNSLQKSMLSNLNTFIHQNEIRITDFGMHRNSHENIEKTSQKYNNAIEKIKNLKQQIKDKKNEISQNFKMQLKMKKVQSNYYSYTEKQLKQEKSAKRLNQFSNQFSDNLFSTPNLIKCNSVLNPNLQQKMHNIYQNEKIKSILQIRSNSLPKQLHYQKQNYKNKSFPKIQREAEELKISINKAQSYPNSNYLTERQLCFPQKLSLPVRQRKIYQKAQLIDLYPKKLS